MKYCCLSDIKHLLGAAGISGGQSAGLLLNFLSCFQEKLNPPSGRPSVFLMETNICRSPKTELINMKKKHCIKRKWTMVNRKLTSGSFSTYQVVHTQSRSINRQPPKKTEDVLLSKVLQYNK